MTAQVGADEWTEGNELEAAGPEVAEDAGDQTPPEPVPLEGRIDLDVDEQDGAGFGQVLDDTGARLPDPKLVAPLPEVVHDTGIHLRLHGHHHTIPSATDDSLVQRISAQSWVWRCFTAPHRETRWRTEAAHGAAPGAARRGSGSEIPVAGDDANAKQTVIELIDDGGWAVDFASYSPAAALDWRGYMTVRAIAILHRNHKL